MRTILLLILCLPACVGYHDMYGNSYASAGGDADVTFPGGGHLTHSHTASWQHTMQALPTVIGGIGAIQIGKAQEVTKQKDSANALSSHISDNQTAVQTADIARKSANDQALIQATKVKQ